MTETLLENRSCAEPRNASFNGETTTTHVALNDLPTGGSARSGPPRLTHEGEGNNEGQDSADVSSVVSKAKKAAQSLWVLIHAQNCRTCPSGSNGLSCPLTYNGCHQSRKLLSHHQKCREIRAKQAGMGRRNKNQQHVCLICSLVARHAKTVLEGTPRKPLVKKQVISSFTLPDRGPDPVTSALQRQSSALDMPPPPPRFGPTSNPGSANILNDSSSDDGVCCSSHPPTNQLMLFSEVAAVAASPSSMPDNLYALGKSLDSSKTSFLTFAASALQNLRKASPTEEVEMPEPMLSPRRSRAESYDERALKKSHLQTHQGEADPTLEFDLKGEQQLLLADCEGFVGQRRARSSSLGMLASACIGCDTIEEEKEFREETFPMDE